jgi:hypothetical protein
MVNALQDFFQREGFRGIGYSGGVAFYKMYDDEMLIVQLVAQETIALLDADKLMKQRTEYSKLRTVFGTPHRMKCSDHQSLKQQSMLSHLSDTG